MNIMNINRGDKFVATKSMWFINEDTVITVTDVDSDYIVTFTFGDGKVGYMDSDTFVEHFEKLEAEEMETVEVTYEYVDQIMQNSEIVIQTVFNNCAVVSCKLPNGFTIVESASCPSVTEYDEEIYADICLDKIAEKIFELETYRLQEESYRETYSECFNCECDKCPYEEDEDADDDFIEPDCENCTDYNCEYNLHNPTTGKYPVS